MNTISSLNGEWLFGQIGCNVYGVAGGLFGFVSISTMVFMSVERYLMVKNPLLALKISNKVVLICISITWLYSSIWIFPQLFLKHGFVLEGFLTSCTFDYISTDSLTRVIMILMFSGGFLVPLLIITVFYILLWTFLRNNSMFNSYQLRYKQSNKYSVELSTHYLTKNSTQYSKSSIDLYKLKKKASNDLEFVKSSDSVVNIIGNNKETKCHNSLVKREIKVAKTIILIVAMFCIAWLPYAVVALLSQFLSVNLRLDFVTPYTTSLPAIFAKTSSIYNPILYTLTNKECKAYFQRKVFDRVMKIKRVSEIGSLKGAYSEMRHKRTNLKIIL